MSSYGVSHKGYVRKENEDAYCIEDKVIGSLPNLYVIADGMGGHRGGAMASKMAVDQVFGHLQTAQGVIEEILIDSVKTANNAIFNKAVEESSFFGMGTTIEVVTMTENMVYIAHVGDSRVYLWQDGSMQQVTKDHSYVQELVDAGVISAEEALIHPNRNRITRALGVDKFVDIDLIQLNRTTSNMTLLMCSDGLTNMITTKLMDSIVNQNNSLKERCEILLEEALSNGGTDNITLVLIEMEGRA